VNVSPAILAIEKTVMMDDPDSRRLGYWRTRRRRRLAFMVGRYVIMMAIVLVVAWLTGGLWLWGLALVASVFLVLRLAFFFYNGRHLEARLSQHERGRRRFFRDRGQ
jgi:fatty acid desaturase